MKNKMQNENQLLERISELEREERNIREMLCSGVSLSGTAHKNVHYRLEQIEIEIVNTYADIDNLPAESEEKLKPYIIVKDGKVIVTCTSGKVSEVVLDAEKKGGKAYFGQEADLFIFNEQFNNLSDDLKYLIPIVCKKEFENVNLRLRTKVSKFINTTLVRLNKSGFTETCERCFGHSHYSHNKMPAYCHACKSNACNEYCYKCEGRGYGLPKITDNLKHKIEKYNFYQK